MYPFGERQTAHNLSHRPKLRTRLDIFGLSQPAECGAFKRMHCVLAGKLARPNGRSHCPRPLLGAHCQCIFARASGAPEHRCADGAVYAAALDCSAFCCKRGHMRQLAFCCLSLLQSFAGPLHAITHSMALRSTQVCPIWHLEHLNAGAYICILFDATE